MSLLRFAVIIFLKDMRVEIRTGEIVFSTALFSLLVVILSAFAFDLNTVPGNVAASGVLWLATAFGGILVLGRTFSRERDFGVWTAILMSPAPRAGLYLGKMMGIVVFLLVVELMLLPIIQLFFHAPMLQNILIILPVLLLGTLGFAASGALFGAMTIRTKLRDLLLGVVMFPLISPILILSVEASNLVISGQGLAAAAGYIKLMVIFDVIFVLGGFWLFDTLMED